MLSRREILKSSRNHKKRQKKIGSLIILSIIVIVVLIGIVAWQSGNEKISISKITVKGNSVLDSEDLSEFASSEMNGRYAGLFKKNNILIYPKNELKDKMLEKYKRVLSIDIYAGSFTSIVIEIVERKPKYLYCGENILSVDEIGKCYFIDDTGYIYSKAPYFSGNVFFEFYGLANNNYDDLVGQYFLGTQDFKKINLLRAGISKLGFDLIMFKINEEGDYTFYIKGGGSYIKGGGRILFNKNQDYSIVLDNLDSAMDSILSLNKKINYIDLRFGNKVFYKFVE
jgi:hypothetical protein